MNTQNSHMIPSIWAMLHLPVWMAWGWTNGQNCGVWHTICSPSGQMLHGTVSSRTILILPCAMPRETWPIIRRNSGQSSRFSVYVFIIGSKIIGRSGDHCHATLEKFFEEFHDQPGVEGQVIPLQRAFELIKGTTDPAD